MPHRLAHLVVPLLAISCASSSPVPFDRDGDTDADADIDVGTDGDTSDHEPPEADIDLGPECRYRAGGSYGVREEQVLPPAALWTCDETLTDMPALVCGHEVTIIHVSTAWCVLCEDATAMLLREVMAELEGEPVALVELLTEGDHDEVATAERCRLWSERFDPDVPTYIPPRGEIDDTLFEIIDVGPPPLTYVLDEEGVIRWRSNVVLPDRVDEEMVRLLRHVREILDEAP